MEAHERIRELVRELAFDGFLVHILRHGVVDVQQRDDIVADCLTDELAERAVNIHFAGNGDAAPRQTAVYIARHEAELRLESRPAFSGNRHIFTIPFVLLNPIQKRELILRELRQNLRLVVAGAELCFHIFDDIRNTGITVVFVESFK